MDVIAERRVDTQPRFAWNICDQQAASQQANMAFVPRQVRPRSHRDRPSGSHLSLLRTPCAFPTLLYDNVTGVPAVATRE